jgi:hydroxysqualene dehydroxylase
MSRPHVAVVGGGLAGVTAALDAADAGARVTLFERRGRLGGLTWSFQRKDRWFDNGQHVFLRCCSAYRRFLDRIGSTPYVHLQERLEVPVVAPGGHQAVISRTALPAPLHLAASVMRYSHLRPGDRLRVGRAVSALRRIDLTEPSLDEVTFGSWLRQHGQRSEAIRALWNLITLPTVNIDAEEASLGVAAMVFRTGLLDRADAGDIGWSNIPLGVLHGDASEKALREARVELMLGETVQAVGVDGDRRTVVCADRSVEADAVIVATPPEVAVALLPAGTLEPLDALGTSPIVNVHLVLDRRVTDLKMAAGVGSPVQFVFDRTDSAYFGREVPASERNTQCLSISISAADSDIGRRPDDLISSYFASLGELFPSARSARLIDAVVSRERGATFRAVPGTACLRPAARTSIERVMTAGAWCDTGWPATMESAVRSGNAAAEAALAQLELTQPFAEAGVG